MLSLHIYCSDHIENSMSNHNVTLRFFDVFSRQSPFLRITSLRMCLFFNQNKMLIFFISNVYFLNELNKKMFIYMYSQAEKRKIESESCTVEKTLATSSKIAKMTLPKLSLTSYATSIVLFRGVTSRQLH